MQLQKTESTHSSLVAVYVEPCGSWKEKLVLLILIN